MTASLLSLIVLLSCINAVTGFVGVAPQARSATHLQSTAEVETEELTSKGLFKRDRYIATNRFAVRKGQQAKFEKRWATRKSRVAVLEGFKYFHLMRRVKLDANGGTVYDEGDNDEQAQENYVSFTVWSKKSDFSAWRSGEAFKEAHGGTSIGAFLSTMVNSALVLRGPPRPAFYDSLFLESSQPSALYDIVDGWRSVEVVEGKTLPAECFVQMERYYVPSSKAEEFEKAWLVKKSSMPNSDDLVVSSLMRRDGQAKGHGTVEMSSNEPTYVSTHVFKSKAAFDEWSKSVEVVSDCEKMCIKAPEKVYYEGTLVISSTEGA
jgi:heme-degrading monooxygenase HmoA